MQEGNILFARKHGVCFIRLTGEIKHPVSACFDHIVQDAIDDETVNDIVLDVTQARYIDSTNLGLMAKVARHMLDAHRRKPVILCENPDIDLLLQGVGFGSVFEIVSRSIAERLEFETAPPIERSHQDRIRTILQAHRALMEINDRNRTAFRPVVEAFERKLT